jgi:hypothetical protein
MDYDIGILAFSYEPSGEFMQNITIIDRDQAKNHQTHVVGREYLIDALVKGLSVNLAREWPGMRLTKEMEGPQYARLRPVTLLKVDGKLYLKASTDTSACDDMG